MQTYVKCPNCNSLDVEGIEENDKGHDCRCRKCKTTFNLADEEW